MAAEDGAGEGIDEFPGATKGATDADAAPYGGDVTKGEGADDSFDSGDWEGGEQSEGKEDPDEEDYMP